MMEQRRNLYFVGFMGVGKTTLTEATGKLRQIPYVELEDRIFEAEHMTADQLFADRGEAGYRDAETAALRKVAEEQGVLVSCGGGIVLRPENVELMKRTGRVIWLNCSAEEILRRLRDDDTRPLLRGKKTAAEVEKMMAGREALYRSAADLYICTEGKTKEQLAEEICLLAEI